MPPSSHKMVFVIGMHRSGTSMLAQLLARHSQASGLTGTGARMDEGSLIQTALPLPSGLGSLGLKRNARFDETSAHARPEVAQALWDAWAPYWDLSRPVLVEKSPNHIMSTRLLQALFPGASFICILRHPIAQTLAISKWATNRSVLQFLINWDLCQRRLRSDLPHLKRRLMVRYEDFCDAPESGMDRMFRFLDLEPEPVLDRAVRSSNDRYFETWQRGLPGWTFPAQKAAAQGLLGRSVAPYGYRLKAPYMTEPADPALARPPEWKAAA